MGFPDHASEKELVCQYRRRKRQGFDRWAGKISCRRSWQPLLFLLMKFHGQKSLAGYSPWGCKESDMLSVRAHTRTHTHTHTHNDNIRKNWIFV